MQFETEFGANGGHSTVLVIEPEQVVRSALYYILRDRYRTVVFAAPGDALATAEAPDVVLLGSAILQNQGEAVLTAIAEQFAGVRILLISDHGSDPLASAALERGVHGLISKPISFDAVRNAVGTALAAPIVSGGLSRLVRVAFG